MRKTYVRVCRGCGRDILTNNPRQRKHKSCKARVKKYPRRFYEVAHSAWARDKQICQECGCDFKNPLSTSKMAVHHIDGNPQNNDLKNLVVLCASCHLKIHKSGLKDFKLENFDILKEVLVPTRKKHLFRGI